MKGGDNMTNDLNWFTSEIAKMFDISKEDAATEAKEIFDILGKK